MGTPRLIITATLRGELSRDYHLHFKGRRRRLSQGHPAGDGRARRGLSPHPVAAQGNCTIFSSPILKSSLARWLLPCL